MDLDPAIWILAQLRLHPHLPEIPDAVDHGEIDGIGLGTFLGAQIPPAIAVGIGTQPSDKVMDFDFVIRMFDPSRPSHASLQLKKIGRAHV